MTFITFLTTVVGYIGMILGSAGRFVTYNDITKKIILPISVSIMIFEVVVYIDIVKNGAIEIIMYSWMSDFFYNVSIGIIIDALSITMTAIVLIISFTVMVYASEYMNSDVHKKRFLTYLLFFIFFMLFFVNSNNIVQAFIGWEGVGIISYLLINFWFTRLEANRSAFKAIIFNRLGDLGYIIFFISILFVLKTANFNHINSIWFLINDQFFNVQEILNFEFIFYFLFLGAMCKSAQIGLHAWLPDAMEGPTPVSALLHSATMVTAGIYIFLRFAPVLLFFIQLNFIIAIIGGITALVGATVAFFNEDIKKIIAYSTCSQLGLLFSAIGIGNYNGCFFHVATHAFFKALLFLSAGCIIHAIADEQDIRKMGGLLKYLPYTAICMFIGILGLVGFPFLSGYFSKEFILFFSLVQSNFTCNFITILIFLASIFTMLYGLKLFFFIFLTSYRGYKSNLSIISEPTFFMSAGIGILSVLTVFAGYFLTDILLYNNSIFWFGVFPPITTMGDVFIQIEMLPFFTKVFLILLFVIFIFIFNYKYNLILEWRLYLLKFSMKIQFIVNFFNLFFFQTWFFNYIYTYVVYIFMKLSFDVFILKINNIIEYFFIIKVKTNIYKFSTLLNSSFSNNFYKNFFFFIFQLLLIFSFVYFLEIYKCILLNLIFYFFYNNFFIKQSSNIK